MTLTELRKLLKARGDRLKAILDTPADKRTDADKAAMAKLTASVAKLKAKVEALAAEADAEAAAATAVKGVADTLGNGKAKRPIPHAAKGQPGDDDEDGDDDATADKGGATKSVKIETGDSEVDKKYPSGGFKSSGHFFHSVIRGAAGDGAAVKAIGDWRELATKAAAGMGITGDPTADIFVPMEFSQQIMKRSEGLDYNLANRVRTMTVAGNSIRIPAWNDASRAEAYRAGGVQAYWEGEGDTTTSTKIDKTRYMDFRLKKLMASVILSNELMEDSPFAIESYVNDAAAEAIAFKLSEAIWAGDGVGKPLGAFNSAAVVSIAKETSQVAATVVQANVSKMYGRLTAASRSKAVWHINQDVEPMLDTLALLIKNVAGTENVGGSALYMPPGGLADAPYGRLKGKPVIPLEFCETLGTVGDIVLADWSQYLLVTKGQTKRDMSMHVKFLTDESVLRFVFRADGQPMWNAPITPLKGSNTTSCFVSLATRG
jgi:HK97 family phage major capsid protein